MFEIKGKVASALCYASVIEPEAEMQIKRMCDYELTADSRVRIMPDVHAGAGCTIGTTMTVKDKICPNIVGVDIGCGMYTVKLNERNVDFSLVDKAAHIVPSGMNVRNKKAEEFDLSALRCHIKNTERIALSLGTLGGGNHFIEIDRADDGTLYLVVHSGSRNLGVQVAGAYQRIAQELHSPEHEFFNEMSALISEYRNAGRFSEIQSAVDDLKQKYAGKPSSVPLDLCWLSGSYMLDYLHDIAVCQDFARKNRELIARDILEMSALSAADAFHTVHNYIDIDSMILRKGAISARAGERMLIPINMRDGSLLATGRGNPEWNYSAPHGAGRLMSRTAARQTLSLGEFEQSMSGIYTTCVCSDTLDESPMAYKPIDAIIKDIADTARITDILKPVYNFKY